MTCIVATTTNDGAVFMGADSQSTSGWDKRQAGESKVFVLGSLLIGYTTSFRMGQLLRYSLKLPETSLTVGGIYYMTTVFVPAIRALFKDNGFTKIENNEESGGTFMVGVAGRRTGFSVDLEPKLYRIQDDFYVNPTVEPYEAIGCGDDYALATMRLLSLQAEADPNRAMDPTEFLTVALDNAAYFSNGVGRPFVFRSVEVE